MSCRGGSYSGALISGPIQGEAYNGSNNRGSYPGVTLDAQSGNSKYGQSETIQPASAYALMIIKV